MPALHGSPVHPCLVQAVRQCSCCSCLCSKLNFSGAVFLAAELPARRVRGKDLTASLEEVWLRLGLCSLKFKFLFCFRAAEENRFSRMWAGPGGARFEQCFAPSDEAPLFVFREGFGSCYGQKWLGLFLQWFFLKRKKKYKHVHIEISFKNTSMRLFQQLQRSFWPSHGWGIWWGLWLEYVLSWPSLVPAQLVIGKRSLLSPRCPTDLLQGPPEAFSEEKVFISTGNTMDMVCQNYFSPFT